MIGRTGLVIKMLTFYDRYYGGQADSCLETEGHGTRCEWYPAGCKRNFPAGYRGEDNRYGSGIWFACPFDGDGVADDSEIVGEGQ